MQGLGRWAVLAVWRFARVASHLPVTGGLAGFCISCPAV